MAWQFQRPVVVDFLQGRLFAVAYFHFDHLTPTVLATTAFQLLIAPLDARIRTGCEALPFLNVAQQTPLAIAGLMAGAMLSANKLAVSKTACLFLLKIIL